LNPAGLATMLKHDAAKWGRVTKAKNRKTE
jgi:hypothetical protein